MPNYCSNILKISHDDPAMIDRVVDAYNRGELLEEFVPVPAELRIVAGSVADPKKQSELEAQQKKNIEEHGYAHWYDYCVAEWGTKWDVGGTDDAMVDITDTGVTLMFDSAWSPPVEAYRKLDELGFTIDAMYYEPGIGFCGQYNTETDDDFYQIEGDSDWVLDNIPERISSAFGIYEGMADFENENQDMYEDETSD